MRQLLRTFLIATLKRFPTSTRNFIGSRLMRSSRLRALLAVEIAPEIFNKENENV